MHIRIWDTLGHAERNSLVCKYTLTHKVVVPGALCWDHEEAEETVREQHLHLLIVGGKVAVRVVASVLVVPSPLKAQRSQLVGSEGAGAGGEAGPGREAHSHRQRG